MEVNNTKEFMINGFNKNEIIALITGILFVIPPVFGTVITVGAPVMKHIDEEIWELRFSKRKSHVKR